MATEVKWKTIYPAYINSNRSRVSGRRITKARAVEDPKWTEIRDILEASNNIQVTAEPDKVYPRELDKELNRGRVKYVLPPGDSRSKQDILLYLAEMIPKLKSRSAKSQPQPGPSAGPTGKKGRKGK